MLNKVRAFISRHALLQPGEAVWVAVSGGIDSMVLLDVLQELGHPCHVAHVDHGLRGAASDADREFVKGFCEERNIPFQATQVDVHHRRGNTGESSQMAARELRMAWFQELCNRGPNKLATAHHADDAVETFFMGLMQGMGSKSLGSIPTRNEQFIRPLVEVTRQEILHHATLHNIPWREDFSNEDKVYMRNRIRHELLPQLEAWRPGVRRTWHRNNVLFREVDHVIRAVLDASVKDVIPDDKGAVHVPFDTVLGHMPHLLLHHLLRDKGFHPDLHERILDAMEQARTGARFESASHVVWVDRSELVIEPRKEEPPGWLIASPEAIPPNAPLRIGAGVASEIDPAAARSVAWVDADALEFPLFLRPWQEGDRMQPAGLGGSKLISDILIDAKVPRHLKARTYVLVQGDRIIWLCGHRLAEGVKAGLSTRHILRFEWSGT